MRAGFKLQDGVLVITLDSFTKKDRTQTAQLELALLRAYGYNHSANWDWRGSETEGMTKCIITRPNSGADDVAAAQEVLANFCS